MKDISLYGHLTIDTIVDGVKERKTLGFYGKRLEGVARTRCNS